MKVGISPAYSNNQSISYQAEDGFWKNIQSSKDLPDSFQRLTVKEAIPRGRVLVITDLEWRVLVPDGTTGLNYIVEAQMRDEDGFQSFPYLGLIPLSDVFDRLERENHPPSARDSTIGDSHR